MKVSGFFAIGGEMNEVDEGMSPTWSSAFKKRGIQSVDVKFNNRKVH